LTKNNTSGFSALPGGLLDITGGGKFTHQSLSGQWWSATASLPGVTAWVYSLGYDGVLLIRNGIMGLINDGSSVRLVKDN
jgi:hypothetical protein